MLIVNEYIKQFLKLLGLLCRVFRRRMFGIRFTFKIKWENLQERYEFIKNKSLG